MGRARTFTGCWTCRTRRLKCDEVRPECGQCLAKEIPCEGYHTRLQWLRPVSTYDSNLDDGQISPKVRHTRRLLPAAKVQCLSVETALLEIEQSVADSTFHSYGPFSVFLLNHADGAPEAAAPLFQEPEIVTSYPEDTYRLLPTVGTPLTQTESVYSDALSFTSLQAVADDGIVEPPFEEEQDPAICHGQQHPTADIDMSWTMHTLQDTGMPETLENCLSTTSANLEPHYTQASDPTSPAGGSHLDGAAANAVFLNLEVKQLLRNYARNVLHIFSPLDTPDNPWRRFHLSTSLQSSIELEILGHSAPSRRALLYTILTISAYNLRNVPSHIISRPNTPNSLHQDWNDVAARYKCKALKLLEGCIREQTTTLSNSAYNELLAAMLCMVTIDVISGDTCTSEIHLQAAETLVRQQLELYQSENQVLDGTRSLHAIFLYLRTMQEATKLFCEATQKSLMSNTSTSESPRSLIHQKDFPELMDLPGPEPYFQWWSLEMMYGIPGDLLLLLRKATRTLREKENVDANNDPEVLCAQAAVEELENEILEWPVEQAITRLQAAPVSKENKLIMEHYTRAFHHALIVFFGRKARNMHRQYLQEYCTKIISHLEEISEIKRAHNIRSGHMPWPAFVAGCQALHHDLQVRYLQWFDTISVEGILTSTLAKDALQKVWNETSTGTPVGLSDLSGLYLILT